MNEKEILRQNAWNQNKNSKIIKLYLIHKIGWCIANIKNYVSESCICTTFIYNNSTN